MAVVKQLVEQLVKLAIYPLAMGVGVGLCLWVLLGPLRIDRLVLTGQDSLATPDLPRVPGGPLAGISEPIASPATDLHPAPDDRPARPSGRIPSASEDLPLVAGDGGPLVTQLQGALIKRGYSVGLAGADGNFFDDDTLTALGAFQDNNALPVQPTCDQQCWTMLGLPQPE